MPDSIVKRLQDGPLLCDGGMIIEARWRGYRTPSLIVEHPDVLQQIHADFFRAGSQVLQGLTWWTSRTQLERRHGWGDRLEEITRTAIRLARQASNGEAFIGGCLNQTGSGSWKGELIFTPSNTEARARACDEWDEHIGIMIEAGVDLLIPETFARLDEARLCLSRCKMAEVPTIVLMGNARRTPDGASPADCARALVDDGADIVGLVCNGDAASMWPNVLEMRQAVEVPIAFQPAGYRSAGPNSAVIRESMIVSGREMAEYALKAKAEGIHFIGGCCGTAPSHIREMATALGVT